MLFIASPDFYFLKTDVCEIYKIFFLVLVHNLTMTHSLLSKFSLLRNLWDPLLLRQSLGLFKIGLFNEMVLTFIKTKNKLSKNGLVKINYNKNVTTLPTRPPTFQIMFLHSEDNARLDNRPNRHFNIGSLCFSLHICLITQCTRELELSPVLVSVTEAVLVLLVWANELVAER